MPTLNWIGKDAVLNHHKEVPFRLLKCDDKLSVGEDSGNLLVQGDNLEALEARLQSTEVERGRLVAAVMSTVGGSDGE
jgi:hypothetical protein